MSDPLHQHCLEVAEAALPCTSPDYCMDTHSIGCPTIHRAAVADAGGKDRMKDDLIHVGGLLSWSAIRNFGSIRGYEWIQAWMEPQWVAWLTEILKQSDDDPLLFPHGKWATIQHLQDKVAAMAASQRFRSGVEIIRSGGPNDDRADESRVVLLRTMHTGKRH